MVKRIRGTACSLRVSPAISNRLVVSSKGILLKFIPDIHIYTDTSKGAANGNSPGTQIPKISYDTNILLNYCFI